MNCIIVDDEPLAHGIITEYAKDSKYGFHPDYPVNIGLILEKQGIAVVEEENVSLVAGVRGLFKNKKFVFFTVLCLVMVLGSFGWMGMWETGVHTGYQPTQPIKFSHELHAGINKINCQYCHSSASESKHSNIPTTNVCMNCHKGIKGDDPKNGKFGKLEISKIYAAAGFNPIASNYFADSVSQNKAYIDSVFTVWMSDSKPKPTSNDVAAVLAQVNKPIEWTRIHNLPDHVYFNHAQHVNAGKVQCQTCHGPIETMEEVYQYSPLSMGWCINCHRQTEVQFAGNNYYGVYEKLHKELKANKRSKVTVSDIGGTECQRCHY